MLSSSLRCRPTDCTRAVSSSRQSRGGWESPRRRVVDRRFFAEVSTKPSQISQSSRRSIDVAMWPDRRSHAWSTTLEAVKDERKSLRQVPTEEPAEDSSLSASGFVREARAVNANRLTTASDLDRLSLPNSLTPLSTDPYLTMPTVAVVGATGTQGSGVVSALLSDPSFKVRGITTNLNSTRAQALLSKYADKVKEERFSLVVGNLDDESTLKEALEGCDKLFAAFGPGPTPRDGETAEEVQQGKNLVDAAKVSSE